MDMTVVNIPFNSMKEHLEKRGYIQENKEEYAGYIANKIFDRVNAINSKKLPFSVVVFLISKAGSARWGDIWQASPIDNICIDESYDDDVWTCRSCVFMYNRYQHPLECTVPNFKSLGKDVEEKLLYVMTSHLKGRNNYEDETAEMCKWKILNDALEALKELLNEFCFGVSCMLVSRAYSAGIRTASFCNESADFISNAVFMNDGYWCCLYVQVFKQ